MKALKILLISSILFTITTNAQITKGNWMVGGNGNFSYSKTENKNNSGSGTTINYIPIGTYVITIEPNIGYFFMNKFVGGCKLSYLNAFQEGEKLDPDGMNLSIGPYIRYYFLKEDKTYNIFLEPSYNRFLSNGLGNASSFAIKSGFVIFMNNSVGFESSISFAKTSNSKFERNNILVGFGFQIHLEKEK